MLNLIMGRKAQKHYHENKKGFAVTNLRNYINSELQEHNYQLNNEGKALFDRLLSEILNNAEDHSIFDDWFVFANIFEMKNETEDFKHVSEINLAIMNFGLSIFEGFEETKILNNVIYNDMLKMAKNIRSQKSGEDYSLENLFTLYALQEGISRLKYAEESRGSGTMTFITSFLDLGDFQNENLGAIPYLSIYSGQTQIICDKQFQPKGNGPINIFALNNENNLSLPPKKSHLKKLKLRFPGTLLTAKIYLNENHLNSKTKNELNENN